MVVRRYGIEAEWIAAAVDELRAAASTAVQRAAADHAGAATGSVGQIPLSLCLAGGLTPEVVYRAMAALPLVGLAVDLWLGDERAVPAGDVARNALMAARAFAVCAWAPPPRLRPWPGTATEADASAAAARYEAELRAALGSAPAFDLVLLGLGADGHSASLFPATAPELARGIGGRLTAVTTSPLPPFTRMTMTQAAFARARRTVFLVKGADKLPALRKLEAGDPSIPASLFAGPGTIGLYLG